jgi:penicillin-binding protein 1A
MSVKAKKKSGSFSDKTKKKLRWIIVLGGITPLIILACLLLFQSEDNLPSVETLENPPELLASIVYSDDAKTELGRYWKINRTSAKYKDISPYVIDALISTEDERFDEHSGVDFRALARAIANLGSAGGASTITQQLAKLLFTFEERQKEREALASGEVVKRRNRVFSLWDRINEKARENIIASRLEKRYTKREIITMYLNQFDYLYNAVGIENAAKVYYNKKPKDLSKDQAAMLVGMCKNPSYFNPHMFEVKNYRRRIASNKGIELDKVDPKEVQAIRTADSLRAANRRNQVLYQWFKNSEKKNLSLTTFITKKEYDSLKMVPIQSDYQIVDHKQGLAPYFRESLRGELSRLFKEENKNGTLKYKKPNGDAYNIYNDGLKIYTTLNYNMQKHAEGAVEKHLKGTLQEKFDENNKSLRNSPFSNDLNDAQIERIMNRGRVNSSRYQGLKASGKTKAQIEKNFKVAVHMTVFSWGGNLDTTMTPDDSIRYYKSFLHAGLLSVEPQTGFIKAWVGGADIDHFAYDHVKLGRRQVGSTIKPFVYATALNMGVVKPCTIIPPGVQCVDVLDGYGNVTKRWCPEGDDKHYGKPVSWALANSNNPGTVFVMSKMGGYAGPMNISRFLKDLDINLRPEDEVPSMCLGPMDLSLYEMVPAQSMFVNQGIFNAPTFILRIEDRNGNVIYNAQPKTKEVLSQNVAYKMIELMQGTIQFGTGASLRGGRDWGGIRYPTAGKTGTTQNSSDGWFMGLTPELVTGVWVGAEDRSVRFRSMLWGQGARLALPIYGYYMQEVYKDKSIHISKGEFDVPIGYSSKQFECEPEQQLPPSLF